LFHELLKTNKVTIACDSNAIKGIGSDVGRSTNGAEVGGGGEAFRFTKEINDEAHEYMY
jgi:hypothetical protein